MNADRLKTEQAELARDISYLQDCIGSMTPDNIRAVRNAVEAAIIAAQGENKGDRRTYRAKLFRVYDPAAFAARFCEFRDCGWHSAVPALGERSATVCFDLPAGSECDEMFRELLNQAEVVENGLSEVS